MEKIEKILQQLLQFSQLQQHQLVLRNTKFIIIVEQPALHHVMFLTLNHVQISVQLDASVRLDMFVAQEEIAFQQNNALSQLRLVRKTTNTLLNADQRVQFHVIHHLLNFVHYNVFLDVSANTVMSAIETETVLHYKIVQNHLVKKVMKYTATVTHT